MKVNLTKTAKAVAIVAAVVVTVKVAKAVISKAKSGKKDQVKEDVSADISRSCDYENGACDCAGDMAPRRNCGLKNLEQNKWR